MYTITFFGLTTKDVFDRFITIKRFRLTEKTKGC